MLNTRAGWQLSSRPSADVHHVLENKLQCVLDFAVTQVIEEWRLAKVRTRGQYSALYGVLWTDITRHAAIGLGTRRRVTQVRVIEAEHGVVEYVERFKPELQLGAFCKEVRTLDWQIPVLGKREIHIPSAGSWALTRTSIRISTKREPVVGEACLIHPGEALTGAARLRSDIRPGSKLSGIRHTPGISDAE